MKQSTTSKIKIFSRFKTPGITKLKVGSPIFKKYGAKIDEKTNQVVVNVIEKYDIRDSIQSYRKDTDIYYLLQKFKNGDATALNGAKSVFYGDVADMPNSMIDMTQLLQRGEGLFNNLSDEVKEKYNLHNVKDFIDLLFSGKLQEEKIENKEKEKEKETPPVTPVEIKEKENDNK